MENKHLPIVLIIVSLVLIILDFIFTTDKKSLGYGLRLSSNILLIIAMVFTIRERNKAKSNQ